MSETVHAALAAFERVLDRRVLSGRKNGRREKDENGEERAFRAHGRLLCQGALYRSRPGGARGRSAASPVLSRRPGCAIIGPTDGRP